VLAIRSDRFHLLDKLSDYLPKILNNCLEIAPLAPRQARAAITEPAMAAGDFGSLRFTYEPAALATIMHFLTKGGQQAVDTTQLQIICHHLEKSIAESEAPEITTADVGDLPAIIEHYYDERIQRIVGNDQQLAARKLIEDGLIFEEEERRLSLYEGQIYQSFGLTTTTLRTLVDSHLLRAEPSLQGGYTYELSHDTLVPPILKAKAIRKAEERARAEAEAARAWELERTRERQKRRRAYTLAALGLLLAVIAIGAAILAYRQSQALQAANQQLLRSNYSLQLSSATELKVQGKYQPALELLRQARPAAQSLNDGSLITIDSLLDDWSALADWMPQADSLAAIAEFRTASQLYEQANERSPDAYIDNKLRQTREQLEIAFKDYLGRAEAMLNAGQRSRAIGFYEAARALKPNDPEVAEILRQLRQ
ncbi:MAG: hypothetical protein KDC54_08110, partial [Lewinella sp.]|nr:hypothetical protein [Lewinella sp.]